jgi:anti-anti-sigma factor
MDIRIYLNRGNMLVQLEGRVVLDECDRIKSAILPRIGREVSQISLDLGKVDFIDSAGLGVLVHLKSTAMKHRSRLALVAPSKVVYEILMVSKLDSIFDIITGAEATSVISALAQPSFLQAGGEAQADPMLRATNQPAMPMAQARAAAPVADDLADPKARIDQLCRSAVDFMRQGDYDAAADAYIKALAIDPEYLPAHNNLAIVYEKKPHWKEKAVKAWERVLEISTARNDAKHIDRAKKHLASLGAMS